LRGSSSGRENIDRIKQDMREDAQTAGIAASRIAECMIATLATALIDEANPDEAAPEGVLACPSHRGRTQ